jgi:hypothetical protein
LAAALLDGAFVALEGAAAEVPAAASGDDESGTPASSIAACGCDAAVETVDPTANTPAVEPSSTALPTSRLNTRDEGMSGAAPSSRDR